MTIFKKPKIILLLIFIYGLSNAQGFFSVKGKEIIDPQGKTIFLKGINVGNWLVPEGYMFKFNNFNSPRLVNQIFCELIGPSAAADFWKEYLNNYITYQDIKYIKKLGFNHIRVPFNYRMLTDEFYMEKTNHGFRYLDSIVEWCRKEGLWAILDMHCAPGGQTGYNIDDGYGYPFIFENLKDQDLFVEIWKNIATHFKNNTTVIGYEFMNEPIAHFFNNKDSLNPKLELLYKRVTSEVRKIDKNHLLFLGGAQWNTNFSVFGPPFDDKTVYEFHKYWMPPRQEEIQSFIDFGNKYNVPLYMGESGENTDEWVTEYRKLIEKNNTGWCFWTYKKMDDTRCVVTFKKPANYESIIYFAESDHTNFDRIRMHRPDLKISQQALNDFLENCKAR
ncbi:MAG: cellulase family glycosylhydrolase, partial [Bacteroidales bacterium]|nr:cellulase family glycosylhydrolase [Bacteroidales bacterium]